MEHAYVGLSQFSYIPGDTIRFRTVVLKEGRPVQYSTSISVGLYGKSGELLEKGDFQLSYGHGHGSLVVPDSMATGNYYVVAWTSAQLCYEDTALYPVPIVVYNKARLDSLIHKVLRKEPGPYTTANIDGVHWSTNIIHDSVACLLSEDSPVDRRLSILYPERKLRADVVLGGGVSQQYALFPYDKSALEARLQLLSNDSLIGNQVLKLRTRVGEVGLLLDTLDFSAGGYNSWTVKIPDSMKYFTGISVTDADLTEPAPIGIDYLNRSYTDNLTVTETMAERSYISIEGRATRQNGKELHEPIRQQMVVLGVKDSALQFSKLVDVNADGRFLLDSLFFFGDLQLEFQLNQKNQFQSKDVRIELKNRHIPRHLNPSVFDDMWDDDSLPVPAVDTIYTNLQTKDFDLKHMKILDTVTVKGRKDHRRLDGYATGPFAEEALFTYDLLTDTSEYDRDIFWFLGNQGGRLRYDPVMDTMEDVMGHPIHWFLDEQEYTDPRTLRAVRFDDLAKIKVLESDFLSTSIDTFTWIPTKGPLKIPDKKTALNICLYSRKDADYRLLRGGLNHIVIHGYTPVPPFQPNERLLYWNPVLYGSEFNVKFNNVSARRFRVHVEGVKYNGEIVNLEKVIQ